MKVIKNIISRSKYNLKCPHVMNASCIVVHNTANDASARSEIAYMLKNKRSTSYHYAIDDKEIVQGITEDRNAWHAGDGGDGHGNREGIAIEICYSRSGGVRFIAAEKLTAKFIAVKLKEKGWGMDCVKKHQDFSGKYCPHRTLNMGWGRFLDMVEFELELLNENKKELSAYAQPAYNFVTTHGISDGTNPKDTVTREQLWTMLYRFFNFLVAFFKK